MRIVWAGMMILPVTSYAAASDAMPGLAGMVFSLLLILGLFVLAAWLAKRYLPMTRQQGLTRIVSVTSLGAREKLVVVEVKETWLVLGVGGGNVHLLHSMDRPLSDKLTAQKSET